jgi:TetR/AcrR family transcriptional regulator
MAPNAPLPQRSGQPATGRRRPRRVGRPPARAGTVRSRSEILDAALEAFGATGYDAMSVRELTRRLGVSHNLVHHYFRSKAVLWRAAIDHAFGTVSAELAEAFRDAPAQGDVLASLRQAMVIFLTVTARFPANGHIIVREGALGGPRLDYLFTHYVAPNLDPWRALLSQAQREGKLRADIDIRTLFFLLTDGGAGPYTSQALAKRIGGADPLRPEAIRAHAELVADLLLRGIVTERDGSRRGGAR